jgi:hypothetical protein
MGCEIRERLTGTRNHWPGPMLNPCSGWFRMPNTLERIPPRPRNFGVAFLGGLPSTNVEAEIYPPIEYIGLGGGTNFAVLIWWPIHLAFTEPRMASAMA